MDVIMTRETSMGLPDSRYVNFKTKAEKIFMMIRVSRSNNVFPAFFGCLVVLFLIMATTVASAQDKAPFDSLMARLIRDGFEAQRIQSLFQRPEVGFEVQGISLFFRHSEARLDYDQFSTPASIQKAKSYMERHGAFLEKAERGYGVDREVITAIILVETRLGEVTGNRSILNSLSTMASLSEPGIRETMWDRFGRESRRQREDFDGWCDRKSRWAYDELKAYMRYTARENIDPIQVAGSYAGALGIAQFMPTSIIRHARDGNEDGRIDLFDHADAIASVASYLKHYGWRPGIEKKAAYQVIHHYNMSKYYVNAILKITDLLKG
jgi:membrane-bound lytic murein transglycosylase B